MPPPLVYFEPLDTQENITRHSTGMTGKHFLQASKGFFKVTLHVKLRNYHIAHSQLERHLGGTLLVPNIYLLLTYQPTHPTELALP